MVLGSWPVPPDEPDLAMRCNIRDLETLAARPLAGAIPAGAHRPLQHVSVFLVAVALSAIGLSTNVAALRRAGHKPLLLGALLWLTVAGASLGLQALTGT